MAETPPGVDIPEGGNAMTHDQFMDMCRTECKNIIKSGDMDAMIIDRFEKIAFERNSETGTEQSSRMDKLLSKMSEANLARQGKDGAGAYPWKVAKGKEKLWQIRQVMGGDSPPAEIGKGELVGAMIPFVFKFMLDHGPGAPLAWSKIAEYARTGKSAAGGTIPKNLQVAAAIEKAQTAGSLPDGGALIPQDMSADLIGFLFDANVVRALGARTVDMPNGSLDFGRINTTVSASYIGETGSGTSSKIGFGRLQLSAKKLKIQVVASNDLIRQSPFGIEQIILDQMRSKAANRSDLAALRGTGTLGEPAGISNMIPAGQKVDRLQSGGTSTLAEIVKSLFLAIDRVASKNIPMTSPGWVFNWATKLGIMSAVDADGNMTVLADMLSEDMLLGFRTGITNSLPSNLGGGDETEIYFGDFAQFVIGETLNVRIDSALEATVLDSTGAEVKLFEQDMMATRLILEEDFGLFYDEAFSMIEAVDWGPDLVA